MSEDCLKIGDVQLKTRVMLAPMAGYTDVVFRMLVRGFDGLGLAFSEMLNPKSLLCGGGVKRDAILATNADDKPLSWQVYGGTAEPVVDGAQWLVEQGAAMLDINMGCPKRKIASRGAGAGLLKDPESAVKMARSVVDAVHVPVSAKIRLGWDGNMIAETDFIRDLEQAGVSSITVHPRTASQGYSGRADWSQIRFVVERVKSVPVIGSGDITTPEDALRMVQETGCAGVMIGRQALKTPWIIRDVSRVLSGLPALPPPERAEIQALMKQHFETVAASSSEARAPVIFQKWIPLYAKTLNLAKSAMITMIKTRDSDVLRKMMDDEMIMAEHIQKGEL